MTCLQIPMMWQGDGQVMVPAGDVTALLRLIDEQLGEWPDQGADPCTVQAVQGLLRDVADRLDVDLIAIASGFDGEL